MPQLSTLMGLNFLAGSRVAPVQGLRVEPGPEVKGLGPYFNDGVSEVSEAEGAIDATVATSEVTAAAEVVVGVTTTCGGLLARSSWLIGCA